VRVVVVKNFASYRIRSELAVDRALSAAGKVGEGVARARETRVKTRALAGSIRAGNPYTTKYGRTVDIIAADYKAVWHELGTRSKRRRALVSGGKSRKTGGVTPLYFLMAGKKAAEVALFPALKVAMPKR
jgi:hypothetical protein